MLQMKAISEDIHYLEPEKDEWANAYVPVPRFNILTSNSAESFNSTLEKLRNGGYLRIFTNFSKKLGTTIYSKHSELAKEKSWATEKILEKWSHVKKEGVKREIIQISNDSFVVSPPLSSIMPDRSDRIVNIAEKTCTCGVYQQECFPCIHCWSLG